LVLFFAGAPGLRADDDPGPEEFKEVYGLIRQHLTGMSDAELNRTAVKALVAALGPKVSLVTNTAPTEAAAAKPPVTKTTLFGGDIVCLRVRRVTEGLADAVREACGRFGATNKLHGIVLDLRYADGHDYAAAASVADLFLKKERPLLDWGAGVVRSKEKEDALALPVAVLVNHQTEAAAEALAAVLRETGTGLILGNRTAGEAMISQEFRLADGERLRIASAPIRLGDGSALSAEGVKPDISVEVSPQDERAYYADTFQPMPGTNGFLAGGLGTTNQLNGTNRVPRRTRFNEAELVRERKEGTSPDLDMPTGKDTDVEQPTVRDPVLARALDVLKGLAMVRHLRS
jgi:hypothetical protein